MTHAVGSELEQLLRRIVREEMSARDTERESEAEHITVAEYAKRWSLAESTVRVAIKTGRLPCERIGRAVRVPADAKIGSRIRQSAMERAVARLTGGRR